MSDGFSGVAYRRHLAREMFRIAFRVPRLPGIDVSVVDCLMNEILYTPSKSFRYKDDGISWWFYE